MGPSGQTGIMGAELPQELLKRWCKKAKQNKLTCFLDPSWMFWRVLFARNVRDHFLPLPHPWAFLVFAGAFGHPWRSATHLVFFPIPSGWVFLCLWPPGDCVPLATGFWKESTKSKPSIGGLNSLYGGQGHVPSARILGMCHLQTVAKVLPRLCRTNCPICGGDLWMWQAGDASKQTRWTWGQRMGN